MDSDFSTSDENNGSSVYRQSTKKRKKIGRMKDVMKTLRLMSHETGNSCNCSRLKCFDNVVVEERKRIIKEFNSMLTFDEQNSYLSGLITVLPIMRHRPRTDNGIPNAAFYSYRLRVKKDKNNYEDIQVCYKAFLSVHGITGRRVQTIQQSLRKMGVSPTDKRGKHSNRPHKHSNDTITLVNDFIKSLRGRKSHYSLKDTNKIYLPENLNISKLYGMFNDSHPENHVSYDTFRAEFNNNFNISFGYPRKDTCSTCDAFRVQKASLTGGVNSVSNFAEKSEENKNLAKLEVDHNLHLKKAETFYSLKRFFRKKSLKSNTIEAIVMDFQKNLHTPNITTNDVYYRRQLNFYSFNIHVLSTSESVFYTYDETVAKKGSDDVCSMLDHFINHYLSGTVQELVIFCDSCGGQNKNYTVFRYLHYLVSKKRRFDYVKVLFPVRGHSYMECDKNMSFINQKANVELPEEWREVIRNSRTKPTPFGVINCDQTLFKSWSNFLKPFYKPKCPFPTRAVRCIKILQDEFINYRNTFFGNYMKKNVMWQSPARGKNKGKPQTRCQLIYSYDSPLPVSTAKYNDLKHLAKFLVNPQAARFYTSLPRIESLAADNPEDIFLDYELDDE